MSSTTEIVFILDRSGSMQPQATDVLGGFNSMLEQQRKKEIHALVTTVLFDTRIQTLHDRLPIAEIPPLTGKDYCVGGGTALLDAVGETIRHIQNIHRYARLEDRPAKTLVIIMTDGEENSSRQFNNGQVKRMVREQEEVAGWEFLFIGADIDAFAAAADVGIRKNRVVQMYKAEDGYRDCFDGVSHVMCRMAKAEEKLQDDDWDTLLQLFGTKKPGGGGRDLHP